MQAEGEADREAVDRVRGNRESGDLDRGLVNGGDNTMFVRA